MYSPRAMLLLHGYHADLHSLLGEFKPRADPELIPS